MYTNGTTNYNLPQYVDSDKATWTDLNAPFNAIDAAIKGAVDDTAQEALDIDALKARMDTAEQNIGTNTADIAGLDTRLTTAEGAITSQASQIADVKQDTEDMICAYNEASATSTHRYEVGAYFIYNDVLYKATQVIAIGDTIVPDTNCETTNVTTEIMRHEKTVALFSFVGDGVTSFGDAIVSLCNNITSDLMESDNYPQLIFKRNGKIENIYHFSAIATNYSNFFIDFSRAAIEPTGDNLGFATAYIGLGVHTFNGVRTGYFYLQKETYADKTNINSSVKDFTDITNNAVGTGVEMVLEILKK